MRRGRRGVTLVEVMVAMAVGMVMLVGLQDFLYRGSSMLETSHQHLEAATAAQLLVERIHSDVRRLAPGDSFVSGGSSGPPVSLLVSTPGGGTETVTYDTSPGPEPGTFYVRRNGRVLRAVTLKELSVRAVLQASPSGKQIYGVQTVLLATDGQGRKEFALVDFTAADALTMRALDPYWVPNP